MKNVDKKQLLRNENGATAIGLARYAFDYIEAARLVDEHAAEHNSEQLISPIPAYFLAAHGIELTLKAYLRHNGLSISSLSSKQYGHDLLACYRKAKELGLLTLFKVHVRDIDAMRMLVHLNRNHGLRYLQAGTKQFPLWSLIEPYMVRLHQAVAPAVGYNKTFAVAFGGYA
jgi:hypothetical protein